VYSLTFDASRFGSWIVQSSGHAKEKDSETEAQEKEDDPPGRRESSRRTHRSRSHWELILTVWTLDELIDLLKTREL